MKTEVAINPEVASLIGERDDFDNFVNSVLMVYLTGGFFSRSEVAGVVNVKGFVERLAISEHYFDTVTSEFKGIVVTGERDGDSVFVPNQKLLDLIRENTTLVVLKTPRQEGISTVKAEKVFIPPLAESQH